MGPLSTIDSVLRACENTSGPQLLALQCELTALTHLQKKDYQLLFHRRRHVGVEVDLLMQDSQGILQVIEVKSFTKPSLIPYRLSSKQHQRLLRVKHSLQSNYGFLVEVRLILVQKNEVLEFLVG